MTAESADKADIASASPSSARWLRALPILVLAIAIAGQGILMATVNIDRQTGSGFAMFSSVDFAGSRSIVATATADGQPVTIAVPRSLDSQVDDLLYAPTDERASELAAQLAELRWSAQDGTVAVATADATTTALSDVSVTVRRLTAAGHTLASEIVAQGSAS